jgi:hypothetical protein
MNLKNLFGKAKDVVDDRGGADNLKKDAKQVADAVTEKGASVKDKAQDAVESVKKPG